MRRVVQDAFGEDHPWFEVEPDRFTCAKNWAAALERRERQPQGLHTDKTYSYIVVLFDGHVVNVADEHPGVPQDVLW